MATSIYVPKNVKDVNLFRVSCRHQTISELSGCKRKCVCLHLPADRYTVLVQSGSVLKMDGLNACVKISCY